MERLLFMAPAVSSYRAAMVTGYFISGLAVAIALLLLLIWGRHAVLVFHAQNRDELRMKVLQAVEREIKETQRPSRVVVPGRDALFSRRGMAVATQVFDELDVPGQDALRHVLLRMGAGGYLAKRLKDDDEDYLVELVRLVGAMDLVGLEARVTALLYAYKNNIDLQYESFLALSRLGSFEPLKRVCMDEGFVHTLSFRSLQQILMTFAGDRARLYQTLLDAPDHYVVRACLKRIGAEGMEALAPLLTPWLDNDDYNLVIDAVRSLGQLRYAPAAGSIAALLGHRRWEVRGIAATALALVDSDGCEDALIGALQDSEWQVRYNAGAALRALPHGERIYEKVEKTQDKYALEMLRYMMEMEEIERRAQ